MPRKKICIICQCEHSRSMYKTCSQVCQSKHERLLKIEKKEKEKVKKEKIKTKKAFSRSSLIKEADRVFSLYIRERDRGKPCITSGVAWQENHQCGHFMSRRHLNTRWHEMNAHSQSPHDNMFQGGEQYKHGIAIDKLYGVGTAEGIMRLANDTGKTTDEEILMHIKYYYGELDKMLVDYKPKKLYLNN